MRENWIELSASLIAIIFIPFILTDYLVNFPHIEVYQFLHQCAFSSGPSLRLEDLKFGLHPCLDGDSDRTRFLSGYFWILNAKFRHWLFEFVPFHPSVSFNWLFTLIASPIAVFFLSRKLIQDSRIAVLASVTFLMSIGNLSNTTMYFHAAKPLATLGIALGLLITYKIAERLSQNQPVTARSFFFLAVSLLAFMFTDEIFYVYFLVAPVLFWEVFIDKRTRLGMATIYVGLFATFIVSVGFLIPHFIQANFHYDFNFFRYAFATNESLMKFNLDHFLYNFRSLISTHLDPLSPESPNYYWQPGSLNWLFLIGFGTAAVWPLIRPSARRGLYIRFLVSILIFIFFNISS